MISKEQMYHIIDCVEAQAKSAAEKPDPHNLMQLGASIASLRIGVREMYATTTAAETDGWIEWGGGVCPVDGYVDIKLRGGVITKNYPAGAGRWVHDNQEWDIIAYRVVS